MGPSVWYGIKPTYSFKEVEQRPGEPELLFRNALKVTLTNCPWSEDDLHHVRQIIQSTPMPWMTSSCHLSLGGQENDELTIWAERDSINGSLTEAELAVLEYELRQMVAAVEMCDPIVNDYEIDGPLVVAALRILFENMDSAMPPQYAVSRARKQLEREIPQRNTHEWAPSCIHDLHQWCDDMSLPRVRVPAHVTRLFRSTDFNVWSSRDDVSPSLVYAFTGHPVGKVPFKQVVWPGSPPTFMFGIAGLGINSQGLGIIAKGTGYAVALQTGWGAAYRSPTDSGLGAALVAAWNNALGVLETEDTGQDLKEETLILFSDYRGICELHRAPDVDIVDDPQNPLGAHWNSQLNDSAPLGDQLKAYGSDDPSQIAPTLSQLLGALADLSGLTSR